MNRIELQYVHRDELNRHLTNVTTETDRLSGHVNRVDEQATSASKKLSNLEVKCRDHLVTTSSLSDVELNLDTAVATLREEFQRGQQELYNHAASLTLVKNVQASLDEAAQTSEASLIDVRQEVDSLIAAFRKEQQSSSETFETKSQHTKDVEKLAAEKEALEKSLRSELDRLTVQSATKEELNDSRAITRDRIGSLQDVMANMAAEIQERATDLKNVEELCANTLATKDFAHENAKSQVAHAIGNLHEKGLIGQLRREFEEEKERSRQTNRQVAVTRKDLTDMMDIFHETRESCVDLNRTCTKLSRRVEDVDLREAEHWSRAQATASRHGFAQQQLHGSQQALRDEFLSATEVQRGENEKLRIHSTQRYLEQMDRALDLHRSLETVSHGHKELTESVRSIKLPKV